MPKQVTALLFALMLLVGSAARAGDIPESIMAGRHKAMLIGQITAIGTDTVTIEPLIVMMGDAGSGPVAVQKFESYSYDPHPPRKGDYLVALLLDEHTLDDSWVFECSSSDYKTLEIVHCDYSMVRRYQQYINEGAYIEAQKKLDSMPKDPNATASPIPTAGEETAQPTAAPDPTTAAAQSQPGSTDGTKHGGAIAAIGEQGASGGVSAPAAKNRDLIMLAVVLGVLALGSGFALLHHLAQKRASAK